MIKLLRKLLPAKKLEVKPEKKLYIIDVLSSHRVRYVVECTEPELDNIVSFNDTCELTEFSQEHLGDNIVSYHPIKNKEYYLKLFDEDNAYAEEWSPEQKFKFINRK